MLADGEEVVFFTPEPWDIGALASPTRSRLACSGPRIHGSAWENLVLARRPRAGSRRALLPELLRPARLPREIRRRDPQHERGVARRASVVVPNHLLPDVPRRREEGRPRDRALAVHARRPSASTTESRRRRSTSCTEGADDSFRPSDDEQVQLETRRRWLGERSAVSSSGWESSPSAGTSRS